MEEMQVSSGSSDELEDRLISENAKSREDAALIKGLIHALSDEQKDGEKKYEYEDRVKKEADGLFN